MNTSRLRIAGKSAKPLPRKLNLTEAMLPKLNCPAGKPRAVVYDSKVKGLAYFITAPGSRAFYWYGRVKGQPRPVFYHLGSADGVTLADARTQAQIVGSKAAQGIDPRASRQQEKAAARVAITLDQLWESYKAERLAPGGEDSTLRTDRSLYKCHLLSWANRSIQSITAADVENLHRAITVKKKLPVMADKAVKLLRRMFSFAKIEPNPASGTVTFHGDKQRTRFLADDELARLLSALDTTPNQTIADAIRFALMTGARKRNICRARWADINLAKRHWMIPAKESKSRKDMTIPLVEDAIKLLDKRRQINMEWLQSRAQRFNLDKAESCEFVFPGRTPDRSLREVKATWEKVRQAAGISDVRFHDLRHTLASWMAMTGASFFEIKTQIGHIDPRSTHRYTHLDLGKVRPATANAVAAMFNPTTPTPADAAETPQTNGQRKGGGVGRNPAGMKRTKPNAKPGKGAH